MNRRRKLLLTVFIALNIPLILVSAYVLVSGLPSQNNSPQMLQYHSSGDTDWVTRYPYWEGEYTVAIVNKDLPEDKFLQYRKDVVWALRYWEIKEDVVFNMGEKEENSDVVIVLGRSLDENILENYMSLSDRVLAVGYAISMRGKAGVKTGRTVGPVSYEFGHGKVRDITRHEIGHLLGKTHADLERMGIR